MKTTILRGDVREMLATLPDESVHCCVTSPPYWGLRDYGVAGQLGLESAPAEYVEKMVAVFREVRRVLRDDGTLRLNLGDSYARMQEGNVAQSKNKDCQPPFMAGRVKNAGLKPKDLVGIPWRVAFALQADGWYLRQDMIWHKPNPMPESVTDRCTKAHEYIFLLSKSERYYYDAEAIAEPVAQATIDRLGQASWSEQKGSTRVPGKTNGNMKAVPPRFGGTKYGDNPSRDLEIAGGDGTRYLVRLLLVEHRLYQLTAMARPPAKPDFERFFESFQLTGFARL